MRAARWAEALWRVVSYVSVVQLHLQGNVLMRRELRHSDVKARPSGHWGTVPGTALALVNARVVAARLRHRSMELVPLLGAGHAGVVQLALSWATGDLARERGRFSVNEAGLTELARSFPFVDGLGAEVNPCLPDGGYLGGWLGGVLSFAQGFALDAPGRVVMPILGDGECETPTTAASWLAQRELGSAMVLPVVQVNGFRMGGPSVPGSMTDRQLRRYFGGLGWCARVLTVDRFGMGDHRRLQGLMASAADAAARGVPTVLVVRCPKGWGGPECVDGRRVLGTSRTHKTPLGRVGDNPEQLALLRRWLVSYRPAELFDATGRPGGVVPDALRGINRPRRATGRAPSTMPVAPTFEEPRTATFGDAVAEVLRRHAGCGHFRVFSPDELASNNLDDIAAQRWSVEVLAEEVLLGWLAGWTASGRRGVLVTYEAFASLLTTGLVAHLKHRRLACSAWPSANLVLTSYGWHNVYTHGDPSLTSCLLALGDPAVRVFTPADPARTASVLHDCLISSGRVNVIVAGKHRTLQNPRATLPQERSRGLAVWPHLSDEGEPDLVLVAAGDLPASLVSEAASLLRTDHSLRVRVVNVADLTVLGAPERWPAGLADDDLREYVGEHAAVLVVTLGHPAAVWGLLSGRWADRPVEVIGWREPPEVFDQAAQAGFCGMTVAGVRSAALSLLTREVVAT